MAVRRRPAASAEAEQEDAPKVNRSSSSANVSDGWGSSSGGSSESKRETVKSDYLRVSKEKTIIKLIDEKPVVRFLRHYVGGRYQNCPESLGVLEGDLTCPLCDDDAPASEAYLINVVDMSEGPDNSGEWAVKTWTFGKEVRDQLVSFLDEERYNPLNQPKCYWQVHQVGGGNERKSTKVFPVKDRDLQDDYGIEPLTEEEFDDVSSRTYGADSIFAPYVSALKKLVGK